MKRILNIDSAIIGAVFLLSVVLGLVVPKLLDTVSPREQNSSRVRVLVVGDSITYGTNSSNSLGYRSWLKTQMAALGHTADIVLAGAPGMTLDRVDPYINDALRGEDFQFAVFNLGTNDWKWSVLDGWPERYRDTIRRVIEANPGIKTLVGLPTLQYGYETRFRDINRYWIPPNTVAPLKHLGHQVDTVAFNSIPMSYLTDGVHPGDAGYKVMSQLIVQAWLLNNWL